MTEQSIIENEARYRLRVEDYLVLDHLGAFDNKRTELIDGEIIVLNAEFRPHAYMKTEFAFLLRGALQAAGSHLSVLIDASVGMGPHDMPLPDVIVTDSPRGEGAVPPASVAILIEIATSTLAKDLKTKAALYARWRIPEYWVVDMASKVVHQMWRPSDAGYAERHEIRLGLPITARTINALTVETAAL